MSLKTSPMQPIPELTERITRAADLLKSCGKQRTDPD